MFPKEVGIFIADDDTDYTTMMEALLGQVGYRVLTIAHTLEEALVKIPQLTIETKVALLDGNLRKEDLSGSDGLRMVEAIREHAPWVKTVGISASGEVRGVDINWNMHKEPIDKLMEIITIICNRK